MYKLLFLLFIFTACSNQKEITTLSGNKMTIDYKIKVGSNLSRNEIEIITNIIDTTFDEIDSIYNKWNPKSEISRLNLLKKNEKIKISPELESFLSFSDSIVRLTDGKFDPTIEPIQKIWKESLSSGKIPSSLNENETHLSVGWNKIHIQDGFFYKDHDDTSIDLGGIAKGYLVDLLTDRIVNAGFQNIYVEWGGEIKTHGMHPDNRYWNVFISRLGNLNPEESIAFISLKNEAIATSGDYLQNWNVDGKTYFHIIDPKTTTPLIATDENIASASVVSSSCAVADALATALMCFETLDDAKIWIKNNKKSFPHTSFFLASRKEIFIESY